MSRLTSTVGGVAVLLMIASCSGKKSEPKPEAAPPPAAAETKPAPAVAPTTGAIAGDKYKMNVRLGEQTAPPVLQAPPPTAEAANTPEAVQLKGEQARAAAARARAKAAAKPE
jgi:hypothetical protein